MLTGIFIRPLAWREVKQALDYLQEQAGTAVAGQFLDQFIASCSNLVRMPEMGPLCGFNNHATKNLRRWPIESFETWLIFYQVQGDGIDVVHVLHGARDIQALLDG